jgi:subtilase family protein
MRTTALAAALVALATIPTLAQPKPIAANLGGGLAELAKSGHTGQSKALASRAGLPELKYPIVFDAAGRPLVRITLDGRVPAANVLEELQALPGAEVRASDFRYRAGVIEAYVPAASLAAVAATRGVRAVVPSSPMRTDVGAANSQGLVQHRINRLPARINGRGITVGVMSDSFDKEGSITTAADDVASGDLPGPGNPFGNSTPVTVIEEGDDGDTDEGRAMAQIVHDVAPKAKLGFATANGGEVNFANNIRSLANLPGAPHAVPGFKADIIVDDVIYPTEPMFQDGVIAQAVDDVAAAGVSHFSSAGNRSGSESYDSKVRIVPGRPSSWANTNLDFTGVDPALYAGGFHDFDEGAGRDIAQTVQFDPGSLIVFQWNEPFDPIPDIVKDIAQGTGTVPENGDTTFTFDGDAGQLVEVFVDGDLNGPGQKNPDVTFALLDPGGNLIQFVDNTTNPERLVLQLPATGTYTVIVDSFTEDQFGDFVYRVSEVTVTPLVLSDYNLLFFFEDGSFAGDFSEQNLFSNRPVEAGNLPGLTLQLVIARANTPPKNDKAVADRIRYVGFDGVRPQEHFSYIGPVTYGHNSARGAMSVAAYPFFPPFIPEFFTSPGPSTIYIGGNNRRLGKPDVRQKPDLAAMDGGNTTFFFEDALEDPDTLPNFFGTSAAAPHAAAIGALVLQAAGGPGSVTPNRMRRILQRSAFPHDLDPHFSAGAAQAGNNLVAISASGDQNQQAGEDPNFFTLWKGGPKRIKAFSINVASANPTGRPKGLVFDEREDLGLPFVVGTASGLSPSDVRARFQLPASPPGVVGQWRQLRLNFLAGSFGNGDLLGFAADRDEADAFGPAGAVAGGSADLLGNGVVLPSGEMLPGGARFFGSYEDGSTFEGRFQNQIGRGYSPLDGTGFINAEAAVNSVLPK